MFDLIFPEILAGLVIGIKGAGDIASGIAWRLHRCGLGNIAIITDPYWTMVKQVR